MPNFLTFARRASRSFFLNVGRERLNRVFSIHNSVAARRLPGDTVNGAKFKSGFESSLIRVFLCGKLPDC